jgi:hypothetical protein
MRSTSMSGGVVLGGKHGGGTKVPAPPAPVCGGGWGIQAGRSRVAPPEEVGTSPQEYGSTCAIVRTGPRVLGVLRVPECPSVGLRTDPGRDTGARADTFDDGKKEDDGAARRGLLFPAVRRCPDATAVATRAAVIPAGGGTRDTSSVSPWIIARTSRKDRVDVGADAGGAKTLTRHPGKCFLTGHGFEPAVVITR